MQRLVSARGFNTRWREEKPRKNQNRENRRAQIGEKPSADIDGQQQGDEVPGPVGDSPGGEQIQNKHTDGNDWDSQTKNSFKLSRGHNRWRTRTITNVYYYKHLSKLDSQWGSKPAHDSWSITLAKCTRCIKVCGHFSNYGPISLERIFGPGNCATIGPTAAARLDDVCPDYPAGHRVLLHFDPPTAAARQQQANRLPTSSRATRLSHLAASSASSSRSRNRTAPSGWRTPKCGRVADEARDAEARIKIGLGDTDLGGLSVHLAQGPPHIGATL